MLRPVATKSISAESVRLRERYCGQLADHLMGGVDACLGFGGARLGSAPEPFHFRADAILQRVLTFGLRVEDLGLLLQKRAVVACDLQEAVHVDAVQLGNGGRHVFQEVAVVADQHAGKRGIAQQLLQPVDAGEIEVIGGFVQEKDCRVLHQRLGNRQALAPSAGEGGGFQVEILEAGAAQRFRFAGEPFGFGHARAFERLADDGSHGDARRRTANPARHRRGGCPCAG